MLCSPKHFKVDGIEYTLKIRWAWSCMWSITFKVSERDGLSQRQRRAVLDYSLIHALFAV